MGEELVSVIESPDLEISPGKWDICPRAEECDGAKDPEIFWKLCLDNYHLSNCKPYLEIK